MNFVPCSSSNFYNDRYVKINQLPIENSVITTKLIPLTSVYPFQELICMEYVKYKIKSKKFSKVRVVEVEKNIFVILDGHHTVCAKISQAQTTIKALVYTQK